MPVANKNNKKTTFSGLPSVCKEFFNLKKSKKIVFFYSLFSMFLLFYFFLKNIKKISKGGIYRRSFFVIFCNNLQNGRNFYRTTFF